MTTQTQQRNNSAFLKHSLKHGLLSTTSLALAGILSISSPASAQSIGLFETPTGPDVKAGGALITKPRFNQLNVDQRSDRLVIEWQSFNIGRLAGVNFDQDPGDIAVNRVDRSITRSTAPTQILGRLTADSNVVILDQNGVIFGSRATVDVGGLIASTGDLKQTDEEFFFSTNPSFDIVNTDQNKNTFGIVNNGTIRTVRDNGLVAFVAPFAKNRGTITARVGRVTLAAAKEATVTVDLTGDQLVSIAANKKLGDALVENSGSITAAGGTITLSANAAKSVVDNVINMTGVVNAATFRSEGGKIILDGGQNGRVNVAGTATVSSTRNSGGTIEIGGRNVDIQNSANLRANGGLHGGTIDIGGENTSRTRNLSVSQNALLSAFGLFGNGGSVSLHSTNSTLFNGTINATNGIFSPNAGTVSIGTDGNKLGFHGTVFTRNLFTPRVERGSLTLSANNATLADINSKKFDTDSFVINAERLARALELNNVSIIANKTVDTAGKLDIDLRPRNRSPFPNTPNRNSAQNTVGVLSSRGQGDLTIDAQTLRVNSNNNIIFGNNHATLNVNQIDLKAQLLDTDGTSQRSLDKLTTTTALVRILSNKASIQQGIDLVNAELNEDAKVEVHSGTFRENITVDKDITLQGINNKKGDNPVLIGTQPDGTVVIIASSDAVFDNFDVRASDKKQKVTSASGISISGQDNVNVKNSSFTGFDTAATVSNESSFVDFTGNTFTDNRIGASISSSDDVSFNTNTFTGRGTTTPDSAGIIANAGKRLFVIDNEFFDNNVAISANGVLRNVRIADNEITNANVGIDVDSLQRLRAINNTMTAVYYGLQADNITTLLRAARNTIDGAGAGNSEQVGNGFTGIQINGSMGTTELVRNTVSNFKYDGFNINNAVGASFDRNTAEFIDYGNGFTVSNSAESTFLNNTATQTGNDGFRLTSSADSYFELNTSTNAGGNGFSVLTSNDVELFDNTVNNAGNIYGGQRQGLIQVSRTGSLLDCINCEGFGFENDGHGFYIENSRRAQVLENHVFGARNDGVHVTTNTLMDIYRSTASTTTNLNSNGARVIDNELFDLGDDGVDFNGINNARARLNTIERANGNGIEANRGNNIRLVRNFIREAGLNGIDADSLTDSIIRRNRIIRPGFNGIDVASSDLLLIERNRIRTRLAEQLSEEFDSITQGELFAAQQVLPLLNERGTFSTNYGIVINSSGQVDVIDNTVRRFDGGIVLNGVQTANVTDNLVTESISYGFASKGFFNQDITLTDNTFEDNTIGARFESGSITLAGTNTITGGETGLVFSPQFNVEQEEDGPFQEGEIGLTLAQSFEFDEITTPQLELVGNTLGSTVFNGQSGNYIVLENGALFDPGAPTVINGVGATFDGVSGAILTQEELDAIEDRIVDNDDDDTLGQIFVGFVPATINQEDVLTQILQVLGFNNGAAGVTVTGLPTIPGFADSIVDALNAISTQAGGETPEELNALSPEANEDQAACWGDLGGSGSGTFSLTLGENPSDILSDLAGCNI